jgi:hypothetical protein
MLAPDPAKRSAPWTEDESEPGSASGQRVWLLRLALAVMLVAVLAVVFWPRGGTREPAAVPDLPSSTAVPPSSAGPPPSSAAPSVLELDEPTDLGAEVKLTWTTTDDRLFFGVVVWVEGEASRTVVAEYNRTKTVPVEPGRKYCFMVRGTDGDRTVESQSRAVRGADCQK